MAADQVPAPPSTEGQGRGETLGLLSGPETRSGTPVLLGSSLPQRALCPLPTIWPSATQGPSIPGRPRIQQGSRMGPERGEKDPLLPMKHQGSTNSGARTPWPRASSGHSEPCPRKPGHTQGRGPGPANPSACQPAARALGHPEASGHGGAPAQADLCPAPAPGPPRGCCAGGSSASRKGRRGEGGGGVQRPPGLTRGLHVILLDVGHVCV